MGPDKERPAENTYRIVKGLDAVWPISARQNRVCPCQAIVTWEEEPKEAMGKIALKKHTDTKTG